MPHIIKRMRYIHTRSLLTSATTSMVLDIESTLTPASA